MSIKIGNSRLLELIPTGRDNARTAQEISDVLGWGRRDFTKEVEKLRCKGVAVCACAGGYFLAETTEELENYCKRFRKRLSETSKTLLALENHSKNKNTVEQDGIQGCV